MLKSLKTLLRKIAVELGLIYDPSNALILPQIEKKEAKPSIDIDKDVIVTPTGLQKFTEDTESESKTVTWEPKNSTKEVRAVPQLTDADKLLIEQRGLDIHSAASLKPIWASGVGYKEGAAIIGKKGLGASTVSKYWAVFNSCVNVRN